MAKEVKVSMGGRNYTVTALPIIKSKEWREALAIPFSTLTQALTMAQTTELDNLAGIGDIVNRLSGTLLGSVDLMLDLMFSYSPELAKDREWIENNAYDEEALQAFGEVLKLAFPFGILLELVTGRMGAKTSLNSPSRNGASPLPASGPLKKSKTT